MRDSAGAWDLYIAFAERYHWTPAQVDALDPDVVDEFLVAWEAQADHYAEERARADRAAQRKRR